MNKLYESSVRENDTRSGVPGPSAPRSSATAAGHAAAEPEHERTGPPHVAFSAGSAPRRAEPSPVPATATETLLSARALVKSYHKEKIAIPVLRGVDFDVHERAFTAIVGQSGSGKSTLLHLLATLDSPDEGEIHFAGDRIDNLPAVSRDLVRNRCLGMIFQFYHLLPELTTLENVLMPCMISESVWSYWRKRRAFQQRAEHLLEMVGLSHRLTHRPRELSGGEMQRAAIARALIADPDILLADEPTGNLDQKTGQDIMEILRDLNQKGLTIVMVTHDSSIAAQAHRTVRLCEGRVEEAA